MMQAEPTDLDREVGHNAHVNDLTWTIAAGVRIDYLALALDFHSTGRLRIHRLSLTSGCCASHPDMKRLMLFRHILEEVFPRQAFCRYIV